MPPPRDAAPAELDVSLDDVVDTLRTKGVAAALGTARSNSLEVAGDRVEVVVEAEAGRTADTRSALASRGALIERTYGNATKALVSVDDLASLAGAAGVRAVEPPARAYATAVTGQGVSASNAAFAHAAGDKGAGVKVGIVDLGFAGYADRQAEGDLPASVTTQSFCSDFEATEHGTGVAEIVHEVAPEAQLYLICIEDAVDLGAAKDYAVANGITILNLSVAFFNSSRGDGSGGPATPDGIVEAGRDAGILWVVAAGNNAEGHWSGTFSGNGDGWHDFVPGDEEIGFRLGALQEACVFLKWDAWPTTATQDFDLGLYEAETLAFVAGSAERQTANNSEPTEAACVQAPADVPAQGKSYVAAIWRAAGTAPRMDLYVSGADLDQYNVASGSILEPASAPEALATGAVCWSNGALEPYSSQGPTIDGRTKPDVAGFDSNSSASYGAFSATQGCGASGFTGTSAAAPHVAGAAAILKQQHPTWTAAELRAEIEGTAEDLGTAGRDNLFGWGSLRLPAPPQATSIPAQSVGRRVAKLRGLVTANRWAGTYRWEYSPDSTFATFATTDAAAFDDGAANDSATLRLDGLEPLTTYYARFVTENDHGSATGTRLSFTTADTAAPYVSISDATAVGQTTATVRGVVNPNGLSTTYRFAYGTSFPPATSTAQLTLTGDASHDVLADLAGLTAGRTYTYRLTATNSAGTTQVDGTFATQSAPAAPTPPPSGGGGGGAGPDLDVIVGHGPTAVAAGETFVYSFVVRNKSAAKGSDVALTFALPQSLELVSTYAERGPGCTASGGQVACPLVYLDGSQSTNVRATMRVRANGPVTTTASVRSSEGDLNAADNQTTYSFTAGPVTPAAPPPATPPPTTVILPVGTTKTGSPSGDTMRGAGGHDTFRGLGGADRLYGGSGNDRLFGGAGNDRLFGGAGRDLLDAGPGNDTIAARDKTVDTIRCGKGRDTVVADRKDKVSRDCEVVRRR